MKLASRVGTVAAVVSATLMLACGYAFAAADSSVTTPISDATANLKDTLMAVVPIGLGIGVVLFAVTKGWRLVRRFAK